MIRGIGIDIIEINRFAHWHSFASAQLQRIFSIEEIAYCLEAPALQSAARFAVRFAAREAFFKALQAAHPESPLSFLTICRSITTLRNQRGLPSLKVQWKSLATKYSPIQPLTSHLSLSHSDHLATAIVILEK